MADGKPITVDQSLETTGNKPSVRLVKSDFDVLIDEKGVDVWHDHAIKCPCSSKNGAPPQSTCKNCNGSGWLYVNRLSTRMVIQSMNVDTKLKEWSSERRGTAKITARAETRLTFMDRITILNSESEHSEVLFLKDKPDDAPNMYGTLKYNPVEIYAVFLFIKTSTKLRLLKKDVDYEVERNQIRTINLGSIENPTLSVRYRHRAEYTVLDLPRDVMVSTEKDKCAGTDSEKQFPISAMARRSHYVIDRDNYSNNDLLDNSFTV